jgi:hypothetical protein
MFTTIRVYTLLPFSKVEAEMISFLFSLCVFAQPQASLTYHVEDKIGIWMENQSGNILYQKNDVFQAPYGYIIKKNTGYKHLHIDGGYFFTTELPSSATPIQKTKGAEILNGYNIEEKKRPNGSIFFLEKKNGKKSIIGRGHKKLNTYRWFTHETPSAVGFSKPDASFGWHKEGERYLYKIPQGSVALASKKASEEDLKGWNKDVQQFAPKTRITHGVWLNLDSDPELEGLACGVGFKFDACFVINKNDKKWHGTQLKWDIIDEPLPFQKEDSIYVAFRSHPKSKILRVLYFNGTSYKTEFFRPKRKK